MGKPSAPPPPDYRAAAELQGEDAKRITREQTYANRPNQSTPWGSTTWEPFADYDPRTDHSFTRWEQTTTLDPALQQALEDQIALQAGRSGLGVDLLDRARDEYGEAMDWSQFAGFGEVPTAPGAPTTPVGATPDMYGAPSRGFVDAPDVAGRPTQAIGAQTYTPEAIRRGVSTEDVQRGLGSSPEEIRNRAESAIYERAKSRLDPQWEQRKDQTVAELRARGLRPGDEAYDLEMANLARDQNDAYQAAMSEAIMGGGVEGQRQFEQMVGAGEFANRAAQQAYEQSLASGEFANRAAQQALEQQLGLGGRRFGEALTLREMEEDEGSRLFQEQLQSAQYEAALRGMETDEAARRYADELARAEYQTGLADREDVIARRGFDDQMRAAQYQTKLRQQQITEEMQRRGFSLNEINALISGQQVGMPSMPGFSQASRPEETQYLAATDMGYQADLGAFSAEQAQRQALWNAIGSGAGLGLSFARMSDRRLKRDIVRIGTWRGRPWYRFTYVWGEQSEGVMSDEVNQDAVFRVGEYDAVDYAAVR